MEKPIRRCLLWGFGLLALCAVIVASLWLGATQEGAPLQTAIQPHWRVPVSLEEPVLEELSEPEELSANVADLMDWDEDEEGNEDVYDQEIVLKPEEEPVPLLAPHPQPQPQPQPQQPPMRLGQAHIALIIDDVGLLSSRFESIIRLPPEVTLSFLPYADDLQGQVDRAVQTGHDVMLHLPMEPLGHDNPGPEALLTSQNLDEIRDKTTNTLNKFHGFIGVNNHMGSKFTMFSEGMRVVSKLLSDQGLFFVDSRTTAQSLAQDVARQEGVQTIGRDVFLDDQISAAAIAKEMAEAEKRAHKQGYAVVIGHPHKVTLEALEKWIPDAETRGVVFVRVKELVR